LLAIVSEKLERASTPEATPQLQSTPGYSDFMDWNQITELPWFWVPIEQLSRSLCLAGDWCPCCWPFYPSVWRMFYRRVGGAVLRHHYSRPYAAILTILITAQRRAYTGGV